jgi:hypothetical protein
MKTDAFRDWMTGQGGLNEASARSYISYLNGIELHVGVDIAADWDASRLQSAFDRLAQNADIDPKTKANYQSGLKKYEEFRSLTSA